jgi:hypothetical protein
VVLPSTLPAGTAAAIAQDQQELVFEGREVRFSGYIQDGGSGGGPATQVAKDVLGTEILKLWGPCVREVYRAEGRSAPDLAGSLIKVGVCQCMRDNLIYLLVDE